MGGQFMQQTITKRSKNLNAPKQTKVRQGQSILHAMPCHAMPCMMICSAAPVPVRVGGTNAIVLQGRQVKSTNIF
jgi:hypothetical protein